MSTVPVQIPKVSMGAVDATFMGWLVDDGSTVTAQQPIYTVATDKVDIEVESPASGVLRHGDTEMEKDYLIGAQIGHIELV
jgi:pyruvate/2-oxoglutarate dehydrogenase complex dihydrolipoamide acyltransferase (E2) component